jgi:PAS domain S-box-containing protein
VRRSARGLLSTPYLIILAVTATLLVPAAETAGADRRSILLIYAFPRLLPGLVALDQGLRTGLESGSPEPIRFYTEYLDLPWFGDEDYEESLGQLLAQKYAGQSMDLVVACGEEALRIALRHRAALFPGVPIVFGGPDPTSILRAERPPDVWSITLSLNWAGTVDLLRRLHPDTERVVVVGGAGRYDRSLEKQAREAFARYQGGPRFDYLIGLPMPQLLEEVRTLRQGTVIVFSAFFRDGAGSRFSTPEALSKVASASPVAIYSVADSLLGHGIVGGALASYEAHGARAAELALSILRGERPGQTDVAHDTSVYMFDARQLERRGIDERRLPPDSIVRFRSPSVWDRYRWQIVGAIALTAVQSLFIAALLLERRHRRRMQRRLDEQSSFDTFLATLSAELTALAPGEIDGRIQSALARIARELGVDRVSLAESADGGTGLLITHTSVASDTAPVAAAERFPWMAERLRQGHVVAFARPAELPSDAATDRESLLASGVCSAAVVPLIAGHRAMGALSLATLHAERRWPDESIRRLQLLAEVFAAALERREAERAIRESEERFMRMADAAPCMIWVSGVDADRTYFNARWLDFTGRRLEQELGRGWGQGVHPADVEQVFDDYLRAFKAREPFTLDYRLRRADGEYRWLLDQGVPRVDAGGRFRGFIGSCVDVTELKVAQQSLAERDALRGAILATVYGRLAALDRDGVIVTVNEPWGRLAGEHGATAVQKSVGANYLEVCRKAAAAGDPNAGSTVGAIEAVLEGRLPRASLEYSATTAEGERWFELVVEPFQRPEGGVVVAYVDITRRRQAEEEARRQRDELAHVSRVATLGELTAALAHEVNQPLAAILTNAQAARRLLAASDTGDLPEILVDISEDAHRASQIIGRLRALFRKQDARSEPVELNALVTEVAGLLRHDFRRKGVSVGFSFATSLPPVAGDAVQLQQVLLNLLLNAADAVTAGDGPHRRIAVATTPYDAGLVELSVSDTGVGVPESDLERIFAPFVSTKREGLGLGLSISRSIVTAHGGRMWATRNADQGITVHVQLPCVTPAHAV